MPAEYDFALFALREALITLHPAQYLANDSCHADCIVEQPCENN